METFQRLFELRKYNGKQEDWVCHICGHPGTKTDSQSEVWCDQCIETSIKQQRSAMQIKGVKYTGRNEPCPCGSEMKYKHCCLKKKSHGKR